MMIYEDPTPDTPFLRSDCTGQCQQNLRGLPVKHRHVHAHGHSHNHDNINETPLRSSSRLSSRSLRSDSIPPSTSREEAQNHNNAIKELELQRSGSRMSTKSSISTASISPKRKLALERTLDLDNPLRTDYTYSHTQTYGTRMMSGEIDNPRLCRRSMSRHTSTPKKFIFNPGPSVKNFWHRFLSVVAWKRCESFESTTSTIITENFDEISEKNEEIVVQNGEQLSGNKYIISEQNSNDSTVVDSPPRTPMGSLLLGGVKYTYTHAWWMVTTMVMTLYSVLAYPINRSRSMLSDWVSRDKDDKFYENNNGSTVHSTNMSDVTTDNIVDGKRKRKKRLESQDSIVADKIEKSRFAGCVAFLGGNCCWYLLLMLPLLLLIPYLMAMESERKQVLVDSYVIPPFIALLNISTSIYDTSRQAAASFYDKWTPKKEEMTSQVAQDPEILRKLGQLQISLTELEGRVGLMGRDCCKKIDTSMFVNKDDISKFSGLDTLVLGLKAEQATLGKDIERLRGMFNDAAETEQLGQAALRDELASLRSRLDLLGSSDTSAISEEAVARLDRMHEDLQQISGIKADLEKLSASVGDLRQAQKEGEGRFTGLEGQFEEKMKAEYTSIQETLSRNEHSIRAELELKMKAMRENMDAYANELRQIGINIESLKNAEFVGERPSLPDDLTLPNVNELIARAIAKYDQDKTGLADHALEPAGASIVSTRCSETYDAKTRVESIWGIPILSGGITPRTVIQPGIQVGECWAFKGSQGSLVIKLTGLIHISSFSYEHISKAVAPDGHIQSAPKNLEVWGLQNETDVNGVLLGSYIYDDNLQPLQNWPVQNTDSGAFPMVELKVLRNHGHPVYTCLYRFRVHGKRIAPAYGYEQKD